MSVPLAVARGSLYTNIRVPLAYLITFRGYGTWLHGDKRGSIDRFNNEYKSPYIQENATWQNYNEGRLRSDPFNLDANGRRIVEAAVRETCDIRGWLLRAINVRTNHVHTVISIGDTKPMVALKSLKSNATRKLREEGVWQEQHSPWAQMGSRRYLWTERSLELAIGYVIDGQGGDLPDFD